MIRLSQSPGLLASAYREAFGLARDKIQRLGLIFANSAKQIVTNFEVQSPGVT
jgi:hypothetical protein